MKDMEHIPIHEGILPSCFVHDKFSPKCINYPDDVCDMHKVFSGGPGKMRIIQTMTMDGEDSSITSEPQVFNTDENNSNCSSNNMEEITESVDSTTLTSMEDKIFQDLLDNNLTCQQNQGNPLDNPYGYLKMSFSEMTEVMKGNVTLDEINAIKNILDRTTHKLIGRANQRNKNIRNPGST